MRAVLVVFAFIIAIPLILVPLYAVVNPISMLMVSRAVTLQPVTREWRDIDGISDRLKTAVILSEDGQFCSHDGVDWGALRNEISNWRTGAGARGASTITMQVAKNLFLWNDRSVVRKALEVPLALYIDFVLPKRRIMEIYLNIAEWGPNGTFGIEAGAQRAFGTSAENFSWERAGLMAVTLPNPHLRNPGSPGAGLRRLGGIIVARAQQFSSHASCVFDRPAQL
jgi:monofunctional biosynthetic peptidoglycan transglycosylase